MADKRNEKKAPFSLDAYYRNILILNQAFNEDGRPFRDSHPDSDSGTLSAQSRATLWLGCNVLRTPHLAQLATEILRLVNPALSVMGGPANCCGSPMTEQSDRDRALARTVGHFQDEQSPTLVSWCPSCHTNLRTGSDAATWGFEELHFTEFLARHLDRLRFEPLPETRVMLHGHTGTPDRDKDMEYCRTLLRAVPGVTIVAEYADADLGLHCVPVLLTPHIGAEGFERRLEAILAAARAAGAEMLVTIYHSCYRELEKRVSLHGVVVENYVTLLAKALGLPVPANVYREVARGGADRIAQLARDAKTRAIDRSELQRAVDAEFPSRSGK